MKSFKRRPQTHESASLFGLGRKGLWSVADQLVSSLSNFLLFGSIARVASLDVLGAFTLAYSVYFLFLGSSRAASSEPLLIRHSGEDLDFQEGTASAGGVALLIGIFSACMLGVLGVFLKFAREGFFLLGILAPALLLQDCWRYAFFAQGRPQRAFLNDSLWLGIQLISYAALFTFGTASLHTLLISWGLAGTFSTFLGVHQLSTAPDLRGVLKWITRHHELVPRFVGEFFAHAASGQGITYGIALVAGSPALGMLRTAQVMLGPVTMLFTGTMSVAIPESVRLHRNRHSNRGRILLIIGAVLAIGSICWAGILLLVPIPIGKLLLGANWNAGREVLLPLGISTALSAFSLGALIGLRGLGAAKYSYRARLFTAVVNTLAAIIGAAVNGAYGAVVGIAIANAISTPVWWTSYGRASRQELKTDIHETPAEQMSL